MHGHTVGETNSSLPEALGSTNLNMLIDVDFNKEVAQDAAVYWNANRGCLSKLISRVEEMDTDEIKKLGVMAKDRVQSIYSWKKLKMSTKMHFVRWKKKCFLKIVDIISERYG